jgi:hypothetical protein
MQVNVISYSLKELFEKAKNVLVVLGADNSEDSGSLAASLVELFVGYDKKVELLTKTELPLAARPLVKAEQIKTSVEPKSLVISFDWAKKQLDKVSYNLEGDRFNLIIRSKSGTIEPNDASFSYSGNDWDLVVTVGVNNLEQLINLGFEADSFNRLPSLNFDRSKENSNFAKLNIVNPAMDSLCSLATNAFKDAGVKLPTRAAETLLYGMRIATNNFAGVNDPQTFEAAAYCKRSMIPGMVQEEVVRTQEQEKVEVSAPEAWLSPKIFRSNKAS